MGLERVAAELEAFRAAAGSFASGVTVITTRDRHRPVGMTVTAFSSVSLDPLLVLACLNRSSQTYPHVSACGWFGVNILATGADEISAYCARSGGDKTLHRGWLAPAWTSQAWQSPVLAGAISFLDCELDREVVAGTHAILIGAVRGIGLDSVGREPLLHFRGAYRYLAPVPRGVRPRPLDIVLEDMS